ncbi:MAG: hypothetical protein GJ676_20965 [Rhodobacteraceae bacterium]|nr:hypothetical protein [Paracoccaceae bacterium]
MTRSGTVLDAKPKWPGRLASLALLCCPLLLQAPDAAAQKFVSPPGADTEHGPEGEFYGCTGKPLPKFSLGKNVTKTETQVQGICDCIWEQIEEADRQTADLIQKGEIGTDQQSELDSFSNSYGAAIEACSGS